MMRKKARIEPEQLWFPHFTPDPASYFRDPARDLLPCGYSFLNNTPTNLRPSEVEYSCNDPAMLQAIFFRYGSVITASDIKDQIRDAHLIGLDSLFGDSNQLFACGRHIGIFLEQARTKYDLPRTPDIFVNAFGELEETIYRRVVLRDTGIIIPENYFTAKDHSQGRESLRELWAREKHHFQL